MDQTVNFNPSYPFLMNLYEPCSLGVNKTKGCGCCDSMEREILGCSPFTGDSYYDFHQAADRIVFTAMNFVRAPMGGANGFGYFDAVLRPKYVHVLFRY